MLDREKMKSWSEADKFFSFLLILFTQNDFLFPTIIFCLNLAIKPLQRKISPRPKHLISGEGGGYFLKRGGGDFSRNIFPFKRDLRTRVKIYAPEAKKEVVIRN